MSGWPAAPLFWPPGWEDTLRRRGVLLGIPWIGPEHDAHRYLCDQLRARGGSCLEGWGPEGPRRSLALRCAGIIQRELEWPNALFIPEDPFEILCWDYRSVVIDEFRVEVILEEMEEAAGIGRQPDAVWEGTATLTFGQVIDWLRAMAVRR